MFTLGAVMTGRIKILMAEDHEGFRRSLLRELAEDPRIEVLGGGNNGKELLELLGTKRADVVILDLEMPVMDGYETFEHIKKDFPDVKVVMLSSYFNFGLVNTFIDKGAGAYLPKTVDIPVLVEAIHIVYDQGYYLKILNSLPEDQKQYGFSGSEMEVIKAICSGNSSEEVARKFNRTAQSVTDDLNNIYKKAEVQNTSELTLFAVRTGLISIHNNLFLK